VTIPLIQPIFLLDTKISIPHSDDLLHIEKLGALLYKPGGLFSELIKFEESIEDHDRYNPMKNQKISCSISCTYPLAIHLAMGLINKFIIMLLVKFDPLGRHNREPGPMINKSRGPHISFILHFYLVRNFVEQLLRISYFNNNSN
jgi:hypothetical protein